MKREGLRPSLVDYSAFTILLIENGNSLPLITSTFSLKVSLLWSNS